MIESRAKLVNLSGDEVCQALGIRGDCLSGGGGRRTTQVRCKVSQGCVGFVTYARDNRYLAPSDRPDNYLFIESPQILE